MKTFIILVVLAAVLVAYRFYPPFGGRTPITRKKLSPNFSGRKFVNQVATPMNMSAGELFSILREQLAPSPRRKPARALEPLHPKTPLVAPNKEPHVTWLGHSAFLLQIEGKNILLDPMLGKAASPVPLFGPKRFTNSLAIEIADLPPINAVVISHDHYDHLDYSSIRKLRHKATHFFVPLGVAAHLVTWGVRREHITELDWWQDAEYEGITFTCTPSRHFSGRSLTDRFDTLWCSWAIRTSSTSVFFSGDTGYGPHFKEIGAKLGPFDLTLMECGQYDKRWANVHMFPEQTVTAHQDLKGRRMIPIHWGTFVLALHDWTDSVERAVKAGKKSGAVVMTPQIGEVVAYNAEKYPTTAWWKEYS